MPLSFFFSSADLVVPFLIREKAGDFLSPATGTVKGGRQVSPFDYQMRI